VFYTQKTLPDHYSQFIKRCGVYSSYITKLKFLLNRFGNFTDIFKLSYVCLLYTFYLYLTLNYMFQIQVITLGVKRLQLLDGWIPEYVTIEDVSARHMYKFRHDKSEIDNTSVQLPALG